MANKWHYFRKLFFIVAVFAYVLMQGCTALKTFPNAAKPGETVALAVGSADGMTRANTSAAFYLDSDTQKLNGIDLTQGIRGVFKLYADKASDVYNAGADAQQIVLTSGHEPWITIVAIDLPLSLPQGPGAVEFTTSATYPTIGSHINALPVGLEILPGTGAPSDFAYEFGLGSTNNGDLTLLEPLPHAQVMPIFPHPTSWPNYGAIEMKLYVPTSMAAALDPPLLKVLVDDMSVSTSSGLSATFKHDSAEELTVILMSPFGKLKYFESRFSIVLIGGFPLSFSGTPAVTSVRYFDVNGVEVSGPAVGDFSVELR